MSDMPIIVDTAADFDSVVIWMHGLGAGGSDFPPAIPYLSLPESLKVRFMFPNAPVRPVTINGGFEMRSWYDILSMEAGGREINAQQLQQSVAQVQRLIDEYIEQGIAAQRIFLVGFSQGGAVAYEAGLTYPQALGGIVAMSTYLPRSLDEVAPVAPTALPILTLHGEYDDVVSIAMGEAAKQQLDTHGYAPQWHVYPMAHEVSLASLETLGQWLQLQMMK